jgi:hypothetical protein
VRRANLSAPFANAKPLPFNTASSESSPFLSYDGLELYFCRSPALGWHIYVARRTSLSSPWSTPTALGPAINVTLGMMYFPALSQDGLQLFFARKNSLFANYQIHVSTRASKTQAWSAAAVFPGAQGMGETHSPVPLHNGRRVIFHYGSSPVTRKWAETRYDPSRSRWTTPQPVSELNGVDQVGIGRTTGALYDTVSSSTKPFTIRKRFRLFPSTLLAGGIDRDLEVIFDPRSSTWLHVPLWFASLNQTVRLVTYDWSSPNLASTWAVSPKLLTTPISLPGIRNSLLLDPVGLFVLGTTPATHGLSEVAITIPNSAQLIGVSVYAQAVTYDTNTGSATFTVPGRVRITR